MTYVELHARSAFSFLDGASLPEEMAAACAAIDMPAMALIDCNGVYGAPRFHLAAEKTKIRSHFGADVLCKPSSDLSAFRCWSPIKLDIRTSAASSAA